MHQVGLYLKKIIIDKICYAVQQNKLNLVELSNSQCYILEFETVLNHRARLVWLN